MVSQNAQLLASPVELPCGRTVPNRLVKAAMVELQAPFGGGALGDHELNLYKDWAQGGYGMIMTGNIAVDESHLGTPWDVNIKRQVSSQQMEQFKKYARVCKDGKAPSSSDSSARPLAVVQLVHAGRQSGRGFGRSPLKPALAPSSVPMATAKGALPGPLATAFDWALWGPCQAMTTEQVREHVQRFVDSAELAYQAGFDGVELHGSHGYSLASFLSPKTNQRTDEYGGSARKRFRIIEEIISEIRQRVPRDFVIGIKLNSADYVHGGLTEDDALQNVQWLAEMGTCDFVEISGGNYENPSFMMHEFNADDEQAKLAEPNGQAKESSNDTVRKPKMKESTQKREAFFAGFANRAASVLPKPAAGRESVPPMALMVTGGLRSRAGCAQAIESAGVSLCGLARASALEPRLPLAFCDASIPDDHPSTRVPIPGLAEHPPALISWLPLKLVGAGWTTLYHAAQMARIVDGKSPDGEVGALSLIGGLFLPRWLRSG